jgi:hypothetical protein
MRVLKLKLNETADTLQQRNVVLGQRIDDLKRRIASQQAAQKQRLEELTSKDRDTEASLIDLAAKRKEGTQDLLETLSQASRAIADSAVSKPGPMTEAVRELRLLLDGLGPLSGQLPFVERTGVDGERLTFCPQTTAGSGAFVSVDGQQFHLWTGASVETSGKKPQLLDVGPDAVYAAAMGACTRGLVASARGKLVAWDGSNVRPLKPIAGPIRLLSLVPATEGEQPEGLPFVSGNGGPALSRYLWKDANTKLAGAALNHEAAVTKAIVSRDGTWVLSAAARRLYLWDFATGKALSSRDSGHGVAISALTMSLYDDGTTVVSGSSQGELKKWTRSKDILLARRAMNVHQGAVQDVALAEGGRYIISAGSDGYIIWTDPRDGKKLYKLGPFDPASGGPKRLAVSLDGSHLLVGFSDKVRIYSIGDRDFLRQACQALQRRPGANSEQLRAVCERW